MKSFVPGSATSRRLRHGLAAVLLAAAAAGCAAQPREPDMTSSVNLDGFRTRHPIVVQEGEETLDLPIGPHAARLSDPLVASVEGFGRSARAIGASGIVMMVPSGSANEAAAYRASREITAALGRAGFSAHSIEKRVYHTDDPRDAAPIRLSYPRTVAQVTHACGQWPASAIIDNSNADYWNFGCAYQSNIAAMVANPSDLVAPSPIGVPDATRRATVLGKYRKGEKTNSDFGLPSPGVSTVGGGG